IPPLEALRPVFSRLHEAPVSAAFNFHLLDHQLVTPAPPLGDQRRIRIGTPHPLPRRVEDALDPELPLTRPRHRRPVLHRRVHSSIPWIRSRKASSRLRRSSTICLSSRIHAASSSNRFGPRRQCRTRPTFSVSTSPASSSTCTCFFTPVRVISNNRASSLIVA